MRFMRKLKHMYLVPVVAMLLSGCLAFLNAESLQDTGQKTENETFAQKCLACHGSFDELAEKTAGYKTPSEEITTPHRYVPHEEKKDIPECIECHQPHPIPLEDKAQVVKPNNITFCYSSCHHASNLQPCKNCH